MEQFANPQEAIDTTDFDTATQCMAEFATDLQHNEPRVPNEGTETNESSAKKTPSSTKDREAYPARRPIDYRPEFCELVVALGSDGLSVTEIAVEIGVTCRTLIDWCKAHEEFEYAMTLAHEAALAYFERKGREGIFMGKKFNGSLWKFLIQMHFPEEYGDAKDQVETTSQRPFQFVISEDDARL